ncbi:MAG: hypothetical protein K0R48_32 [Gammaproteobacteria bacterium]|nr:hypothetical protein [Gammaproteobacteria bacterium]
MSSAEGAIKSTAEKKAGNRSPNIQSLKTWYAEFNTENINSTKYLVDGQPPAGGPEQSSLGKDSSKENVENKIITSVSKKPEPILKGLKETTVTEKKFSFKVDEESIAMRERINLFQDYEAYFIFAEDLWKIKKTATEPGFYLYFDNNFNVCVFVVHKKGENESIDLGHIVKTEKEKALITEFTRELYDKQCELLQKGIDRSKKLLLKKLLLKDKILNLITAKCTRYLSRTPLSHNEMHPLNVFQFSSSDKVKNFLENYFFEEDVREKFVFEEHFYDTGDAYLVFRDQIISEERQNQIDTAKAKGFNLIEISGQKDKDLNIQYVIDEILRAYTVPGEDFIMEDFKRRVAARAKIIASQIVEGKQGFSDRAKDIVAGEKVSKVKRRYIFNHEKLILSDLIRIYIIATNSFSRTLKKNFIECISRFYAKQCNFEDTLQAIKKLYIDSYGLPQIQATPIQQAVSSSDTSQHEVKMPFQQNRALEVENEKKQSEEPAMMQIKR